MSSLDEALKQDAASFKPDIHSAVAEDMAAFAPKPAAPTKGESFKQGLGDTEYGLGQLVEHTPVLNTVVSGWRQLIQQGLKTAGFGHAAELFNQSEDGGLTDSKAAEDFDKIVQDREKNYQEARQAAGQTGIDWWRLGGNVANPINYLGPSAAEGAMGRIGQGAIQGAMVNMEQPESAPGGFWWEKAKHMATGALAGGAVSALVEGITPIFRYGVQKAKDVLGVAAKDTSAADAVVNDALRAKGIDPETIDLNLLSGMRQDVQQALDSGVEISPEAIINRARAEALPVPVRLTRGQATGDPMLYSAEQNMRGVQGVGEPLTQRLQEQNQAFIDNLDALGAKDAPDTVSAGNMISDKVKGYWEALDQHKNELYDAVRNSRGQPARMDGEGAAREIRETLGSPQAMHAWYQLPQHIKNTIQDLESGDLPLTVAQYQALDKAWGADARAAEGSTANAINQAREILSNANISDAAGQDSMQAFQLAKQAHAQQMSLINPKLLNGKPNPNYQPIVKSVIMDGKVDDVFQKGFMGASPSDAAKNLDFLSNLDEGMKPLISNTIIGDIKRQALSNASDERGTVSQAVLNSWAKDPVKSARLEKLLAPAQYQTFENLAHTAEVAKRFPVASTVNTSNTGSAVINAGISALKSGATAKILKRVPVLGDVADIAAAAGKEKAVQSAINPGVSLKSLINASPKQAATNRALSQLIVPAVALKKSKDRTDQNDDGGQ